MRVWPSCLSHKCPDLLLRCLLGVIPSTNKWAVLSAFKEMNDLHVNKGRRHNAIHLLIPLIGSNLLPVPKLQPVSHSRWVRLCSFLD